MKAVLAKYKSACGRCNSLIWPEEEIVEYAGEWCHADCAPEEEDDD